MYSPPSLFNLYSEYLMQEAISGKSDVLINGVDINNIRHADNNVILAELEKELRVKLDQIVHYWCLQTLGVVQHLLLILHMVLKISSG
ncbi:hypothetical protein ElyMa_001213300 [Elysia marginata]|uniref:Reverse transcriptase domain-containing protein n=1 Tax=Elysia marginata TaxID=1093978 RepID=A0AAV4I7F1_9GAST|nr:hypothetical protein ElyMa_001213300 [Elysia marginata]